MNKNSILHRYIPLVSFLGEVCGKNFEIILHDISNPNNSVIALHNGHLSGRKIGDPMTDLAQSIVRDNEHLNKDYITNYEGRTKDGRTFVSSTFFIKENKKLMGMLCINHDPQDILEISRRINSLIDTFSINHCEKKSSYQENLDSSISDLSNNIIYNTLSGFKVPPSRMKATEKIEVIRSLDNQGVFFTKGAVSQVAQVLDISEPTVYRYLKKIRE